MCAAAGGAVECAEFLLQNGADASVKNRDGATALDLAKQARPCCRRRVCA